MQLFGYNLSLSKKNHAFTQIKEHNNTFFNKWTYNKASEKDIIEKSYESNVDAYSVVKKVVDVFVSVDWIVEKQESDGTWLEVKDTTIHDLMETPNETKGYTWRDIDEQIVTYLLTTGDSYLLPEKLGGKVAEVDVLPSNYIDIQSNDNFFLPNLKYKFEIGKTKRFYTSEELEHIRMFNPSYSSVETSFNGLSVFQVAANVVQVGNDRWDANANLLQNRGAFGLITDVSQRPMTDPEAKQVQGAFNGDTAGTHNYGKVKVTNKDLKYIPMGMSAADLQLVESGAVTLRAMCNVLGMPSSLFNDPDSRRNNNRTEDEKSMYTNVIMPLAEKVAAKHNLYIAQNHFPEKNVRIRKDFSDIEVLQNDKKVEAEKDKVNMEGINIVLNMPISNESKIQLLTENYEVSDETLVALNKPINNTPDEPIQD